MTGAELRAARARLGLSVAALAQLGADIIGQPMLINARQVGRWEDDKTAIPGSVALVLELALRLRVVREALGLAAPVLEEGDGHQAAGNSGIVLDPEPPVSTAFNRWQGKIIAELQARITELENQDR